MPTGAGGESAAQESNAAMPVGLLLDRALHAARELAAQHGHNGDKSAAPVRSGTAPEATGRTGHQVDHRADFYSLGALFYEWATGRPPFSERDPLRLLHEQLTVAPSAPVLLNPALPQAFSDIILRLLEKEPDRRYHTADGLVHDIETLSRSADRAPQSFVLGQRDFPMQLAAPEHPVGRTREIGKLRAALDAVGAGSLRTVIVRGPAGIGKTALVNELKAMAADRDGRCIGVKFDRYGKNEAASTLEALGAIGKLLLTEADAQLAQHKARILAVLGPLAELACVVPEFKLLLGQPRLASGTDAPHAPLALQRMGELLVGILKVVASPERPLVLILDDMQWCRGATVRFVESVMQSSDIYGLLLVGVVSDDALANGHPLAKAFAAWERHAVSPVIIELAQLDEAAVAQMLSEMLRMTPADATALAQSVGAHAGGHPLHTVELVNALRREGLLEQREGRWHWDPAGLHRYVGAGGVTQLVSARILRLPPSAQQLLRVLACLRREAPVELVPIVAGLSRQQVESHVALLRDEGLVPPDGGSHQLPVLGDSVQQAMQLHWDTSEMRALHLALARRLASDGRFDAVAAEQYLLCAQLVSDCAERKRAAALLRAEAQRSRSVGNLSATRNMLESAIALLATADAAVLDAALVAACEVDLHLALFELGKYEAALAIYECIESRGMPILELADAACAQVGSLQQSGRAPQAIAFGLAYLGRLGVQVPRKSSAAALAAEMNDFGKWVDAFDPMQEQVRENRGTAQGNATAKMLKRLCHAAFSCGDVGLLTWLILRARELWERDGPNAAAAAVLSRIGLVASAPGARRTAHMGGKKILAVCEARGWRAESGQCLSFLAIGSAHWFEAIEHVFEQSLQARETLSISGDLLGVSLSYRASIGALLDSAQTLDEVSREVAAGLQSARVSSSAEVSLLLAPDLQLLRCFEGQTQEPGSLGDTEFSEAQYLAQARNLPLATQNYHLKCAIASAVFGDTKLLLTHARDGLRLQRFDGLYQTAWAHWLAALGVCWSRQQERAHGDVPALDGLGEADTAIEWLASCAADNAQNFAHLHLHANAERAWAAADMLGAERFFDEALGAAEAVLRPWHRALITERAARFQLAQGRLRSGRRLLTEARHLYRAWGASAKAALLGSSSAARASELQEGGRDGASASIDELDTLAVLRASQALASERSAIRLKQKVQEVLGSVTGATRVVLALWDEDQAQWVLREGDGPGDELKLEQAGHLVPLSALRYAERTREPLVLVDAVADDRFARDDYFQGVERCSLMVVPILHQGMARAMLVLENRASRGAFSTARLDAVMMIAGQLAVSLESAQLYERLEKKVAEQTQQLREAQSKLVGEARRAGMAQIATNVLHNVGNVLNSVNVSVHVLDARLRDSRAARVADIAKLLESRSEQIEQVLGDGDKARLLPGYVRELAQALEAEKQELLGELSRLGASVEHIKNVVATQQSYAGASGMLEPCSITDLVEDALRMQDDALVRESVNVQREYEEVAAAPLDKTRVMQILVNLVENARHAMALTESHGRALKVRVSQQGDIVAVRVQDAGCGIEPDNLQKIFAHGFTTKERGHGFGLHSSAVAAREMGGSLRASSDGAGTGATFTLTIPVASPAARATE